MQQLAESKLTIKSYSLAKKLIIRLLNRIRYGSLQLIDANGNLEFGEVNSDISATLTVNSENAYKKILADGSIGFAECFINNMIECSNLTILLRIFIINREVIDNTDSSIYNLLSRIGRTIYYLLDRNSVKNIKQHISEHYDLSNDFFKTFLDPTMMYSSALFRDENISLEQASYYKIQTIIDKLDLNSNSRIIEIGSGWGTLAIYIARQYKCHVTTTTISEQQYVYIEEQIKKYKLEDHVTLLKKDYRDIEGKFDRLVSIEMIEAIGYQYLGQYIQKCQDLLTDDGVMVLQAILIRDNQFERAKYEVDFIKKYIFPGSCIPSLAAIMKHIPHTDFVLTDIHDLTKDYSITLKHWRNNFIANKSRILKLGFSEKFIRTWLYYYCYCEAGFYERAIVDLQFKFCKPRYKESTNVFLSH